MLMPKPKKLSAAEEAAIERLKRVAGRSMTRQELLEQRISWVYGNLPSRSRITRVKRWPVWSGRGKANSPS